MELVPRAPSGPLRYANSLAGWPEEIGSPFGSPLVDGLSWNYVDGDIAEFASLAAGRRRTLGMEKLVLAEVDDQERRRVGEEKVLLGASSERAGLSGSANEA